MIKGLEPLKNWSLHTRKFIYSKSITYLLVCYAFLSPLLIRSQIANYVTNGGFEEHYPCLGSSSINQAKGWRAIDSIANGLIVYFHPCFLNMPSDASGVRYQWPKKGMGYGGTTFLCESPCPPNPNRGYFRNRLKGKLTAGKTYCVAFYYNVVNNSSYGINSFGAYFGGDNLDTISKGSVRITYINPQIQNAISNYATDTLTWKLLTGTFTANGTEKHMIIGNFKSDAATGITAINPTVLPNIGLDMNIDHVSCIDIDLPAFAGHDTTCIPGTTVYLGRQRDVGIDEACTWYKLPMVITPTTPAIDTAAGILVSPVITTSYVVRQEICGNVKWDTVVVYKDGLGLEKLRIMNEELKIYPVPANDNLELRVENEGLFRDIKSLVIFNNLGQDIREQEIEFKDGNVRVKTSDLPDGIYSISLTGANKEILTKRFVINR